MKFFRLSLLALFCSSLVLSCTQEEITPQPDQEEEVLYSAKALEIIETIEQHNERSENKVPFHPKEIQDAVDGNGPSLMPCSPEECCYTTADLLVVLGEFGCTSGCSPDADLNCDGVVNVLDVNIVSAYFGCPDVQVIIGNFSGTNDMIITNMQTSQLRNYTTIDGAFWSTVDPGITNVRWNVNGVPISNNIPSFQFEYPGATSFDYAVPCNGFYEVTLSVMVECQIYSTTECYYLEIAGNPDCTTNGCTG